MITVVKSNLVNYIFAFLILSSFIIAIFQGRLDDVVKAMLEGADSAVKISISLIGVMAFWMGIVKIAQKSGFIDILSKIISPVLKLLFCDLKKDSPAFSNIALNITSNALGLANAATPFGIKAMCDMQKENENKEIATDSMCMFLSMNTAGFQLIPSTVLAILIASKASNPTEIIIPTLIVTGSSFIFAILIAKVFSKIWRNNA